MGDKRTLKQAELIHKELSCCFSRHTALSGRLTSCKAQSQDSCDVIQARIGDLCPALSVQPLSRSSPPPSTAQLRFISRCTAGNPLVDLRNIFLSLYLGLSTPQQKDGAANCAAYFNFNRSSCLLIQIITRHQVWGKLLLEL